ncbi:CaiB/BaiF CoA-transferase family protein [Sphingobium sp. Sx8-8]|uniref:CaiB/BaiF CoA transferase family protein n=1 Tax=Sphingobium sp. Sx8-8 TaxID=2933617 RepID=UPI001F58EA98|nr:CaiB/BaiF CoA-transferase family protein [Sphingobium sp. Sx8-8]
MPRVLEGIRILDLGRTIAAPFCTQMLADFGAEVIKVERVGAGDEMRTYGPPFIVGKDGRELPIGGYFISVNRNKESITVDFKSPEGQEIIRGLARISHVCVENYKVGDMARHGLDYASLKAINPDLIYCSITGFGQTGPYADRPAVDSVSQSMSGLMSMTGEPDGPPQKVGVVICDILTGLHATIGILVALRHREVNGGGGQHIDMSLLDTGIAALSHRAIDYLMSGRVPARLGSGSAGSAPAQVYRCRDGDLNLQAGQNNKFVDLCGVIGREDLLADPRFETRASRFVYNDVLTAELEKTLASWRLADIYEALVAVGIICSPVYTLDQTFEDPQVIHRGVRREVDTRHGRMPMLANPIRLSETPVDRYEAPPDIGEHTDAVLERLLGYDADRIARLRRSGVI